VILRSDPNKEKKRSKKKERRAGRRERQATAEITSSATLGLRGSDPSWPWLRLTRGSDPDLTG
jgi:hypothetical protein